MVFRRFHDIFCTPSLWTSSARLAATSFEPSRVAVFKGFCSHLSPISKKSAQSARSSWTLAACEPKKSLSEEEEEDPDRWTDEHGRTWWRSCALLERWYLLGTGMDVDIFWDEPG